MVASVNASGYVPADVSSERPLARRGHGRRDPVQAAAGPGNFAALLASPQPAPHVPFPGTRTETSAGLMFEPPAANAHERRQAAMKADDRHAGASVAADERFNAASVQARREAQSAGERSPAPATSQTEVRTGGASAERSASPTGPPLDPAPPKGGGDGGRLPADLPRGRSSGAEAVPSVRAASPSTTDALASRDGPWRNPTGATAVSGVAPGGAADGAGPETGRPAALIGRILSVSAARSSDSVRAVLPTASGESVSVRTNAPSAGQSSARRPDETPLARPTPDGAAVKASDFDKLIRSLRFQTGLHQSSARMRLHPPELGRLLVDVRLNGEELRIDVRTQTETARALLIERVADLRAALAEAGIHVDRFEVTADMASQPAVDIGEGGAPADDRGAPAEDGRSEHHGHDSGGAESAPGQDAAFGAEQVMDARPAVATETRLDIRV